MEVSFDQLKSMIILAKVVEHGSFSTAAKDLGLSRSAASYHIKQLETRLNTQLLKRSTRSVTLTEAGRLYYKHCQIIAEQAEAANMQLESLQNEPAGQLKICCPANMGLQTIVPALNIFRELYPKVQLDLCLSDERIDVKKHGIDLAISSIASPDPELTAVHLSSLRTCLCGSREYFNRKGRPVCIDDLSNHDWVVYTPGPKTLIFRRGQRQFDVVPAGPIKTNNSSARTAFIEGGQGIGRIPIYDAAPRIKAGTLEVVMQDYQLPVIDVYGIYSKEAEHNQQLLTLVDFLKNHFSPRAMAV